LSTTKTSRTTAAAPAGTTGQNDPDELLELFDGRGNPTGAALSRAAVHVRGAWHQAFHCWIVRPGDRGVEVVLQRRARHKDTFPGCWDAAAAGHWRFGESPEEAAREIGEELGLAVPFAQLTWLGRERSTRSHPNGLVDREHHQVYLLRWDEPLASYRPDPAEVAALAAVAAADLLAMATGRLQLTLPTEAASVGRDGSVIPATDTVVRRSELVPYSVARLRRLLAGERRLRQLARSEPSEALVNWGAELGTSRVQDRGKGGIGGIGVPGGDVQLSEESDNG